MLTQANNYADFKALVSTLLPLSTVIFYFIPTPGVAYLYGYSAAGDAAVLAVISSGGPTAATIQADFVLRNSALTSTLSISN